MPPIGKTLKIIMKKKKILNYVIFYGRLRCLSVVWACAPVEVVPVCGVSVCAGGGGTVVWACVPVEVVPVCGVSVCAGGGGTCLWCERVRRWRCRKRSQSAHNWPQCPHCRIAVVWPSSWFSHSGCTQHTQPPLSLIHQQLSHHTPAKSIFIT